MGMSPRNTILDDTKICSRCGERKPLASFHRAKATKQGYKGRCAACRSVAPERSSREKVAKNDKLFRVRSKFGLTVEEYDGLLAKPCAICGSASQVLDHCHVTGAVRAALCGKCNSGIGMLGDDADRVLAAAVYLLAHQPAKPGARWV